MRAMSDFLRLNYKLPFVFPNMSDYFYDKRMKINRKTSLMPRKIRNNIEFPQHFYDPLKLNEFAIV